MKTTRLIGLLLVAILATGCIVASTASASLPEFSVLPTNKAVSGLSGLGLLITPPTVRHCTADHFIGVFSSRHGFVYVWLFLNCTIIVGGKTCTIKSVGAPQEGLVETNTLNGLLGLVKTTEASSGVGLLVQPTTGRVFTTLAESAACETPETAIEGSIAGEYSPVGKLQATAKLVFSPTTAKGNKPKIKEIVVLSGTVKPKLTAFGALEAAEENIEELVYTGSVEVT
jgi:hypothetical protein